jgi:hypothetical protein
MMIHAPPPSGLMILAIFGIRQKPNIQAAEVVSFFQEIGMNLRVVTNDHQVCGCVFFLPPPLGSLCVSVSNY